MKEEGVVGQTRPLRHRFAGGVGEVIALSDHEGIERVAGVDGHVLLVHAPRAGRRLPGLRLGADVEFGVHLEADVHTGAVGVVPGGADQFQEVLGQPLRHEGGGNPDREVVVRGGRKADVAEPGLVGLILNAQAHFLEEMAPLGGFGLGGHAGAPLWWARRGVVSRRRRLPGGFEAGSRQ
jgi:hypothetical protein